jgi:hypothetical protein
MSGFTDEELRNFIEGAGGPASLARAIGYPILALKDSMVAEAEAANRLAKKMERLSLWLLVVTVAIFVLTGVLVWTAFREAHRGQGQAAGGAWVLWSRVHSPHEGPISLSLVSVYDTRPACQHAFREQLAGLSHVTTGTSTVTIDEKTGYAYTKDKDGTLLNALSYTCLPDTVSPSWLSTTVDPRGPKGK